MASAGSAARSVSRSSEVAWFDITSERDTDHILRKSGSGWKGKPYVAEITYPVLDPSQVGLGDVPVSKRVTERRAMKKAQMDLAKNLGRVKEDFEGLWTLAGGAAGSAAVKQQRTLTSMASAIGVGADELKPASVKSLLRAIGYSNLAPFGHGTGGSKSSGMAILRDKGLVE